MQSVRSRGADKIERGGEGVTSRNEGECNLSQPFEFSLKVTTSFAEFSPLAVCVLLGLLQCPVEVSAAALVLGAERVPQTHRESALLAGQQVGGKFKSRSGTLQIITLHHFASSYSYNTNQRPSSYRHIQGGGISGYNSNQGFGSQYSTFSSQGQRVPQQQQYQQLQQQQQKLPEKTQPRFRQRPPVRDKMPQCILDESRCTNPAHFKLIITILPRTEFDLMI